MRYALVEWIIEDNNKQDVFEGDDLEPVRLQE